MFSTVVGLVLLVSFHVEGLACSDYSSEKSCNFKSSSSYWGCTWDGSSCSFGSCRDYSDTDATQCKNAMGGNQCAWNESSSVLKCDAAECGDFAADEPTCTGNYANLNCVWSAGTCRPYRCGDYTTAEACAAKDKFGDATSGSCVWDSGTTTCLSLSCRNFSLDSATCLAADGPQGSMSCIWSETSSSKCDFAAGCSYFAADQSTCENNNGRLKCVYNGSWSNPILKCSKIGCQEQTSKSACEGFGGCYWSLLGSCSTLDCSDLTSNGDAATKKAVCETRHPECHYDSTCKEGSGGAIAVGVPSSIAVFLLLLALLVL